MFLNSFFQFQVSLVPLTPLPNVTLPHPDTSGSFLMMKSICKLWPLTSDRSFWLLCAGLGDPERGARTVEVNQDPTERLCVFLTSPVILTHTVPSYKLKTSLDWDKPFNDSSRWNIPRSWIILYIVTYQVFVGVKLNLPLILFWHSQKWHPHMSGLCRLVGHLLPQSAFLHAKTWPESQILIFWENVQLLNPHIHSDIYTVALVQILSFGRHYLVHIRCLPPSPSGLG